MGGEGANLHSLLPALESMAVVTLGKVELEGPPYSVTVAGTVPPYEVDTVMVAGSDVDPVAERDRVIPEVYRRKAIDGVAASKRVEELLRGRRIIVGHNALGFLKASLEAPPLEMVGLDYLDTLILSRWMLSPLSKGVVGPTLLSWQRLMKTQPYDRSRSWALASLCPFDMEGVTAPELSAIRTQALLIHLAGMAVPSL